MTDYSWGMQQRGFFGALICRSAFVSAFLMLGVLVIGVSVARAEPTSFLPLDPSMQFPDIPDPSGPDEFSWEVRLGPEQRLEALDEQTAAVVYEEGPISWRIEAGAAHDAKGATVPTSLKVSEGNVVTLLVHHREGNPLANGAPFTYPIIAGKGYETTNYSAAIVGGPLTNSPPSNATNTAPAPKSCLVPRIRRQTLAEARRNLRKASCAIGDVSRRGHATSKAGKVVKQSPRPGTIRPLGAVVSVTLGP